MVSEYEKSAHGGYEYEPQDSQMDDLFPIPSDSIKDSWLTYILDSSNHAFHGTKIREVAPSTHESEVFESLERLLSCEEIFSG